MKLPVYRTVIFLLLLCISEQIRASDTGRENSPKKDLFLTTYVSNQNPFAGEEVELTYTLFFKGIAPKIRDVEKPVHQGIWAEDNTPQGLIPSKPEVINGATYRNAVIKRMKLVPIQSGTLSVTGYRLFCTVPKDLSIGMESEPHDSLTLSAPGIILHVKTLPEPKPAEFNGAVGIFTASASTDRNTVSAGEPLRLTTTITGKGSFRTLPEIPLSLPDGFSLIETADAQKENPSPTESSIGLTRTVTLNANTQGTFTFSPVTFSAFDPAEQRYTTVTSEKLTLTVLPAAEKSLSETPLAETGVQQEQEPSSPSPLLKLLLAPPIALIAVLLYFLLKKFLRAGNRYPGKKQIRKSRDQDDNIQNRKLAHSPLELRDKLYTAVELCCCMDPQSLTRSELKRELKKQGIGETISHKLLTLLDEIDRAEFAPGNPGQEELEELRQACKAVLEKLENKN